MFTCFITIINGCGNAMSVSRVSGGGVEMVHLSCEHQISFDGTKIIFGGATIPASTNGNDIKIGNIDIEPTLVRQASDMIEALDQFQFENCQEMMLATSDDYRMQLSNQNNKLNQIIVELIANLKTANNQTDYKNAVVKADSLKTHLN